jgi:hypothetical protein
LNKFVKLHEKGVSEFGGDWMVMNQLIADTFRYYGFDITDSNTKLACTMAAYRVLKRVHA